MENLEGQRLGHFQIVSKLGEGGMGVVYEAVDERLGRKVAVKVLPPEFAQDDERRERFEQEARLAGGLNHPNILTVHEVGEHEGQIFIVTELLEGEDLRRRLLVRRLSIPTVIDIALQVARGLTAAHDHGVLHRDIKPGNLFVTTDGRVKILDYGLAKLSRDKASADALDDPTVTRRPGGPMGTAGYMAPEQIRGEEVDRRADIWAFGCVLYECLTGGRVFTGKTDSDRLAAILNEKPDWTRLPNRLPPQLRGLLERCLKKDVQHRQRDMGDVALELEQVAEGGELDADGATGRSGFLRGWGRVAGGVVAGLFVGLAAAWIIDAGSSDPAPVQNFSITLPEQQPFDLNESCLAISADGTRVLYVAEVEGDRQVMLRTTSGSAFAPVRGTEGAYAAFFSPDGDSIAFFARGGLFTVPSKGGEPTTVVTDTRSGTGQWGRDGSITFHAYPASEIRSVPATGGQPSSITVVEDLTGQVFHDHPDVLENGDIVYEVHGGDRGVWVFERSKGTSQRLIEAGSNPRFVTTGHLAFVRDGSLVAVPYDVSTARSDGDEVVLNQNVHHFDVSDDGTLVYASGLPRGRVQELVMVTAGQSEQTLSRHRRDFRRVAVSPRGDELAVVIQEPDEQSHIWLLDIARDTLTRVTHDGWFNLSPVWFNHGRKLAFVSTRGGTFDVYVLDLDTGGEPRRLTNDKDMEIPFDISSDDSMLLMAKLEEVSLRGLHVLDLTGSNRITSLEDIAPGATSGQFGPNGEWIAFDQSESGINHVFVTKTAGGPKHKVTVDRGGWCNWSDDGSRIFFRQGPQLFMVPVTVEPEFQAGLPTPFIDPEIGIQHSDISPDGRSVVASVNAEPEEDQLVRELHVVLNWAQWLEDRVPRGSR